ncbi:MAG TPA: hypothetical protein VEK15_15075 [Vicinamibacteria bacterium]|nr:hypothetical protein [Vicinamibacteria bacterium]
MNELAGKARNQGEVGRLVSDSVKVIDEQLDHLHTSLAHIVERLDGLTGQLARLEGRVHEDVE